MFNSQLLGQIQADMRTNQTDPYLQIFQPRDASRANYLTHCIGRVTRMDEEPRDIVDWMILQKVVLSELLRAFFEYLRRP